MPCGGRFNVLGDVLETLRQPRERDNGTGAHIQCPECGWALNKHFTWCPSCGFRLVPTQCEYCNGLVPRDAQNCPGCGAPVG